VIFISNTPLTIYLYQIILMKKLLYSLLALSAFTTAQAQQRLVLVEECTQASCGPCAAQNPALNNTLNTQSAKAISIKYQTSWPGVDPMNAHNAAQVQTRVTYYGVTGVPSTRLDGNVFSGPPSGVTATNIGARYNVAAPFNIVVTHSLDATFNVITVNATITKLAAVTGTDLRAHLVVVEKEINFATAPGSNGEKDFYSIMKRMLPTDQGTNILATMAVGDEVTLTQSWTLANIYDKNQLAVVAFIQDNTSKEVHQTAYSAPQPVVPDVKMNSLATVSGEALTCANNADLTVNIKNNGPSPLTSCTISALVGGVTTDFPWTGNLTTGQSVDVPVSVPLTAFGGINVQMSLTNANTGDGNTTNNAASTLVIHPDVATTTMPIQGFTSAVFPPAGWAADGKNNDAYNWKRSTTGTTGSAGSATLNWYNISSTNEDDLVLPNLSFADFAVGTPTKLSFSVAHAPYAGTSGGAVGADDALNVLVSTNCGASWTPVYGKSSALGLGTAPTLSTTFTPTATQWRSDSVDLSNFNGQSNILIKFNGVSDYGNNVYLDRINVNNIVVATENFTLNNAVNVFPNLTTGNIGVNIALDKPQAVQVEITNALGQRLFAQNLGVIVGGNYPFDLTNYPAGNYFVRISAEGSTAVKKVAKQ
jgi:hypothetical protein